MTKYLTLIATLTTLSLLTLITFAPGNSLSQLSIFVGSLFNITFYSPFDNTPIIIKNTYIEVGGHFCIFLMVGMAVRQWLIKLSPSTCLTILFAIAATSELSQSLVIDRSTSWDDFVINIIAGSIGVFIINTIKTNERNICTQLSYKQLS